MNARVMKLLNVLLVLGLTLSVALTTASPALAQGAGGTRGGDIVEAFRSIGKVVIDILIGLAAVLMAVGIASGFVGGQFMVTVGAPYGLSAAWIKVISVAILGIGAMLTIVIANTIIDAVTGLIPATNIPVP